MRVSFVLSLKWEEIEKMNMESMEVCCVGKCFLAIIRVSFRVLRQLLWRTRSAAIWDCHLIFENVAVDCCSQAKLYTSLRGGYEKVVFKHNMWVRKFYFSYKSDFWENFSGENHFKSEIYKFSLMKRFFLRARKNFPRYRIKVITGKKLYVTFIETFR